jgi:hypothetical protein
MPVTVTIFVLLFFLGWGLIFRLQGLGSVLQYVVEVVVVNKAFDVFFLKVYVMYYKVACSVEKG